MSKHRNFKLSDEAEKVLLGLNARTGESLTTIVEKGLFYYAKEMQKQKKEAPKTLLDLDLDTVKPTTLDVPFTLNVKGIDTYGSKKRKAWLDSDIKQLLKMKSEGRSLDEISEYLGRPKNSIKKKLWETKQDDK